MNSVNLYGGGYVGVCARACVCACTLACVRDVMCLQYTIIKFDPA